MIKLSIKTPNIDKIVKDLNGEIEKDWFIFQNAVNDIGFNTYQYMTEFIASTKHRTGGIGNLEDSITFEDIAPAGTKTVSVKIGDTNILNEKAPYWYLINYGGSNPAEGMMVPGSFNGSRPDPNMRGTGVGTERAEHGFVMIPMSEIAPMNYIEQSENYLLQQISQLLANYS